MKKVIAVMIGLGALVSGTVSAQGIPVYDNAHVILNTLNQVKNYAEFVKQVQSLQDQLNQAKQMYQSMNGVRGMAALINNPNARHYLPKNYSDLYTLASNPTGGYAGLSGSLNAIRSAAQVLSSATVMNPNSGATQLLNRQQTQLASLQATAEGAYNAAGQRFDVLQNLINTVDLASDPKAAADLSNRIAAENAMMQNELAKLNMLDMINRAQQQQIAQQSRETMAKMGKGQVIYVTGY
jgi:type IV secretion system protein VirB5